MAQQRPITQSLSAPAPQATAPTMRSQPFETMAGPPQPMPAQFSPPMQMAAGVVKRKFPWMPIYAGAAMVLLAMILVPAWFMMSNRSNLTANSNQPSTNGSPRPFTNSVGIEFVWIPPGNFLMGANDNDFPSQQPVHEVTIRNGFYLGKYEVSQAQWQAVMGSNPSHFKECGGNCPVENVSWDDAQEFISKLNQIKDGYTYRLPTEAEWEYSCLAGTTGDYAGNLDALGWYRTNSGDKTHPVGQLSPNGFGLFDIYGNVQEWCQDLFHYSYVGAPTNGSAWLTGNESTSRVVRGGAWSFEERYIKSARRNDRAPTERSPATGIRVVAIR